MIDTKMRCSYLAGVLDAKGNFYISKGINGQGNRFYCGNIYVNTTDRELVDVLGKAFGGTFNTVNTKSVRKLNSNNVNYRWAAGMRASKIALKKTIRYLVLLKDQAEVLAKFFDTNDAAGSCSGKMVSSVLTRKRQALYEKLKALKKQRLSKETTETIEQRNLGEKEC